MNLEEYLTGIQAARTAAELEAALRAPFEHSYRGRTWERICKVRVASGLAVCALHPMGRYVPQMSGRVITLLGESYRVARGGNSTGIRYAWHAAGVFVKGVLQSNGLSQRAACRIWDSWDGYPHRCLTIVEEALNGGLADPVMNTLIFAGMGLGPINYSVEANDADTIDHRATRPCECGATLFDWGAGFTDGFTFISWHCNGCARLYTEYVTEERLSEIRQPKLSELAA